jgi:hypothetical protein
LCLLVGFLEPTRLDQRGRLLQRRLPVGRDDRGRRRGAEENGQSQGPAVP